MIYSNVMRSSSICDVKYNKSMHHYCLQGDGALAIGAVAGGGVPGVRVLRLQTSMQMCVHSAESRTLHVVYAMFSTGEILVMFLQRLAEKPSHLGRQVTRQSSCTSAIAAGGPMTNRTRAMQAATETVSLNTAPLAEAIDQHKLLAYYLLDTAE